MSLYKQRIVKLPMEVQFWDDISVEPHSAYFTVNTQGQAKRSLLRSGRQ